MKRFLILIGFALAIAFSGFSQKFALVDMEYILKNIPDYEMMNEQLEQVSKKWQNEIEALENEAQSMYKKYQSKHPSSSGSISARRGSCIRNAPI